MAEVHLAIYDLSRGMARSLSGQFLGPDHALDIIPHTGLVVFGKEYFFGGGIQSESPQLFRQASGMFPISTELLGRTTVTQAEFEEWCRTCMANGRFTMESYDLLERNCNNFCQEAAVEGLKLPNGVFPQWILDVPRRFLASPMGQLIRPMLEQMQVTGGHTGGGSSAPFANAAPAVAPVAPAAAVAPPNPWANLPSSSTTTTNTAESTKAPAEETAPALAPKEVSTPTLDSYTRPLLSNDTKTATLCANKLIATTSDDDDDDDETKALQEIANVLVSGEKPPLEAVEAASKAILDKLLLGESITFALMLFRLMVLHPPPTDKNTNSSFYQCHEWVIKQLFGTEMSSATRSMAWCVLSNAYGTNSNIVDALLEPCIEVAMSDLAIGEQQASVQVRQAAAAFLYNVSLEIGSEETVDLSDTLVSLLCASLDGIALETDDTTRLRRLVVAANICKPGTDVKEAAKSLVNDLGFVDSLREIVASGQTNASGDAAKVQQVAKEFLSILEN